MILEKPLSYPAVDMAPDDGIEGTSTKLQKCLLSYLSEKQIIIIADLLGGTLCNTALLKSKCGSEN